MERNALVDLPLGSAVAFLSVCAMLALLTFSAMPATRFQTARAEESYVFEAWKIEGSGITVDFPHGGSSVTLYRNNNLEGIAVFGTGTVTIAGMDGGQYPVESILLSGGRDELNQYRALTPFETAPLPDQMRDAESLAVEMTSDQVTWSLFGIKGFVPLPNDSLHALWKNSQGASFLAVSGETVMKVPGIKPVTLPGREGLPLYPGMASRATYTYFLLTLVFAGGLGLAFSAGLEHDDPPCDLTVDWAISRAISCTLVLALIILALITHGVPAVICLLLALGLFLAVPIALPHHRHPWNWALTVVILSALIVLAITLSKPSAIRDVSDVAYGSSAWLIGLAAIFVWRLLWQGMIEPLLINLWPRYELAWVAGLGLVAGLLNWVLISRAGLTVGNLVLAVATEGLCAFLYARTRQAMVPAMISVLVAAAPLFLVF